MKAEWQSLSARVVNILRREGIKTLGELREKRHMVDEISGIGSLALEEIDRCLGGGPVMLHLGAGMVSIPNFTNIDTRELPGIDIVASADRLDMFGDNSVDLIYASHCLEHFPRRDTQRVLQEWRRVLKSGGTLRLSVPDFSAVVEVYTLTRNMALVLGHLVGGQEYPGNTHFMVFDFAYLSTLLSEVGFRCIRKWDWRQTIHRKYDDWAQDYYPHMDKEHGILMSLNVEADK